MSSKQAFFLPYLHHREIKVTESGTDDCFVTEYGGGGDSLLKLLKLNFSKRRYDIIDRSGLVEKTIDIRESMELYGEPI